MRSAATHADATVFAYSVSDPHRYGIATFDSEGKAISIEEKPKHPASNWAVTGLYFYDEHAPDYAANIKPSPRGELEITDLNMEYLKRGKLRVERMGRGFAWLDTGTPDSLLEAAEFIRVLEKREGLRIACPEEIAFNSGWMTAEQLAAAAHALGKSAYGQYLTTVLEDSKSGKTYRLD
jgi:glucose-1-phosphate thymidylyltransferase